MPWSTIAGVVAPFIKEFFTSRPAQTSSRGTVVSRAPEYVDPYLQNAAAYANRLYERNRLGSTVYPYQRVADLSGQTMGAIGQLGNISTMMQNPYITQFMNTPMETIGNLRQMASGEMIGNNPHYQAAIQNALGLASEEINRQASGAGRYGSGMHTNVLADTLGKISTGAMSHQYNQDVARMLQANQLMSQAQLGQMNAIGQLSGAQQQAAMGALYGGSVIDAQEQQRINAEMQRWQEEQDEPWQRLNRYVNTLNAIAGKRGVTTQDNTMEYRPAYNPLQSAVDLGTSLLESKFWEKFDKKDSAPEQLPDLSDVGKAAARAARRYALKSRAGTGVGLY